MGTGADSRLDALTANPTSVAALRAAIGDGGADVADALDLRANAVGDEEAARIWIAIAERWTGEPSRQRRALAEAARRAWAAGDLFGSLEELFRASGDASALEIFIREKADSGDTAAKAAAHDELARIASAQGDVRAALGEYEAIGMLGAEYADLARNGFALLRQLGAEPRELSRAEEALARRTND